MAHTSLPWIIGNILFPILISCLLIILFSPFVKRSYTRIILYTLDQFSILVNRHIGHKKRKLFSELRSVTSGFDLANEVKENGVFGSVTVVELGSGRGANFEYYPKGSQITCVEPVREYKEIIHENAARYPHVTLKSVVTGYAEDMSCIKSNSVDVVVSTHVMCSVGDIKTSLGEVKRILKKVLPIILYSIYKTTEMRELCNNCLICKNNSIEIIHMLERCFVI